MNVLIEKSGRILTFYSFKGGSGRSMALANESVLLARAGLGVSGNKVLMIDWDLEAPGLHEFFKENLPNQYTKKTGVIDLFLEINQRFSEGIQTLKNYEPVEALIHAFFDKSAIRLKQKATSSDQPESERPLLSENLWLLKAGRFDEQYSDAVQTFDWRDFFARNYSFFPLLIDYLEKNYDYVLIDSRTGLTDSGGICTSILPEVLVAVFTPTNQGLRVTEMAEKAVNYRKNSDDLRPLIVYPLASRIDTSSEVLSSQWRSIYVPRFERLFKKIYSLKECDLKKYFGKIEVHYVNDLAYGESVAVMENTSTVNTHQLPARYNELAQLIVGEYLPWEMPDLTEPRLLTSFDHLSFAQLLFTNKEFKRAEKHFYRALTLAAPNERDKVYFGFTQYLEDRGELDAAESIYDQWVREPELPIAPILSYVNFLVYKKRDYTKAKNVLEPHLNKERTTFMLFWYAQILGHLLLLDQAEQVYRELIEAQPDNISVLVEYSYLLRDFKKDYTHAEVLFRKLIEINKDEPEGWQANLAQVLLLQGKKDEADNIIKTLLAKDPIFDHLRCVLWFLRLAYFPEWYEKAVKELESLLKKDVRLSGRNFDSDIEVAIQNKHPHIDKIQKIADSVTKA